MRFTSFKKLLKRDKIFVFLFLFSCLFTIISVSLVLLIERMPESFDLCTRSSSVIIGKATSSHNHLDIDVVYTWVNGSDENFLKNLEALKLKYLLKYGEHLNCKIPQKCNDHQDFILVKTYFSTLESDSHESNLTYDEFYWNLYLNETSEQGRYENDAYHINHRPREKTKNTFLMINCTSFEPVVPSKHFQTIKVQDLVLVSNKNNPLINSSEHLDKILRENLETKVEKIYEDSEYLLLLVSNRSLSLTEAVMNEIPKEMKTSLTSFFSPLHLVVEDENFCLIANSKVDQEVVSNRFADNEELRYSLRSLEKFAPWIRNVYLVTNGQVPYWLNLNHPNLRVIKHDDIFPDKKHLPTFNSAAIECHIHRIPGLSETFLYFNDDFFLGKPTSLYDFYSQREGYKIRLAWPVPSCASNCPTAWLADGFCDKACNTSLCLFDGGDCLGNQSTPKLEFGSAINSLSNLDQLLLRNDSDLCASGCVDSWLADGICDSNCNTPDCGFDIGDCNLEKYHHFSRIELESNKTQYFSHSSRVIYVNMTNLSQCSFSNINTASYEKNERVRKMVLNLNLRVLTILFKSDNSARDLKIYYKCQESGDFNFTINFGKTFLQQNESSKIATSISFTTSTASTAFEVLQSNIYSNLTEPKILFRLQPELISHLKIFHGKNCTEKNLSSCNPEINLSSILEAITAQKGWLDDFGKLTYEKARSLQEIGKMIANHEEYRIESFKNRRLLDAFSDSIVYVNYLYNKAYGFKNRKIPAHVPYIFNKNIIQRLWKNFTAELEATSSHQIRSEKDMQFPFAYYYFLMSEKASINPKDFLKQFDTDGSRTLSLIEQRALFLNLGDDIALKFSSFQSPFDWSNCSQPPKNFELVKFEEVLSCEYLVHLITKISAKPLNLYTTLDTRDVYFMMLRPNMTLFMKDVDHLLRNSYHMICINDDISSDDDLEDGQLRKVQKEVYNMLFPDASSFELPLHTSKENGTFSCAAQVVGLREGLKIVFWSAMVVMILLTTIVWMFICRNFDSCGFLKGWLKKERGTLTRTNYKV